jgi:diguanylate cyclase (GGDEF)-like protein
MGEIVDSDQATAIERTPRATLTPELVVELSSFGRSVGFSKGSVVFHQAEPGDAMYIVERGEIGLVFEHGKPGKNLGPGGFFGELALLTGSRPRTATAVAVTDAILRMLDQTAFDELLANRPGLLAVLLVQTCAYLVESEQQLIADLQRRNLDLEQSLDFLRRMRQELDIAELRAQTDGLTGLYNRRCLDMQIGTILRRAYEGRTGLAVLLLDLDRFKDVNDRHGHQLGDAVLREVAQILKTAVRQTDLPFRIGGDEFLVLMPGLGPEDALRRGHHILAALLAAPQALPHLAAPVHASIGLTLLRDEESWASLFARADQNLYRAKSSGGGRIIQDEDG